MATKEQPAAPQPPAAAPPAARGESSRKRAAAVTLDVLTSVTRAQWDVVCMFAEYRFAAAIEYMESQINSSHKTDEAMWSMLFDAYMIANNSPKFEMLAAQYASRFGRVPPPFVAYESEEDASVVEVVRAPRTFAPKQLTEAGAANELDDIVAKVKLIECLVIDFSGVVSADKNGVLKLHNALSKLYSVIEAMEVVGLEKFLKTLRNAMNGAPESKPIWDLAFLLLRCANLPDQFEDVALDYAGKHGVSPPSWEPAPWLTRDKSADSAKKAEKKSDEPKAFVTSMDFPKQFVAQMKLLEEAALKHRDVRIDMRRTKTLDFPSAAALLDFCQRIKGEGGRTVTISGFNGIVGAMLDLMGVHRVASLTVQRR